MLLPGEVPGQSWLLRKTSHTLLAWRPWGDTVGDSAAEKQL